MKTAVDELIEKIQLEFNIAEEFYLEHKTRESYLVCRTFQLCLKFAKETKEKEKKQNRAAYKRGQRHKKPLKDSNPITKYLKQ
jgi:hypothetical protein